MELKIQSMAYQRCGNPWFLWSQDFRKTCPERPCPTSSSKDRNQGRLAKQRPQDHAKMATSHPVQPGDVWSRQPERCSSTAKLRGSWARNKTQCPPTKNSDTWPQGRIPQHHLGNIRSPKVYLPNSPNPQNLRTCFNKRFSLSQNRDFDQTEPVPTHKTPSTKDPSPAPTITGLHDWASSQSPGDARPHPQNKTSGRARPEPRQRVPTLPPLPAICTAPAPAHSPVFDDLPFRARKGTTEARVPLEPHSPAPPKNKGSPNHQLGRHFSRSPELHYPEPSAWPGTIPPRMLGASRSALSANCSHWTPREPFQDNVLRSLEDDYCGTWISPLFI